MTPLITFSLIALLLPVAPTPQPVPPVAPSPVASTAATALPAPVAPVPAASASVTTIAAPTPAPAAAATLAPSAYGYRFVPHQPTKLTTGQPQIYAVYLNAMHLRSHGPIDIRVETNENVVKVESKSNGRGGAVPQIAPGVFAADSALPAIPFIAAGMSTDLLFIATSADGRTVTVRVPVLLG